MPIRPFVVFVLALVAYFSGGGMQTPLAAGSSGLAPGLAFATYKVLHAFDGSDGVLPYASLVWANGLLYGTTLEGGRANRGTVFSLSRSGVEQVVHAFGGSGDGKFPIAGLAAFDGTLYGTTERGGGSYIGTVFAVNASGSESVVYSFPTRTQGANPTSGLTSLNGELYGTTSSGGTFSAGTVYRVDATGKETVLHDFGSAYDGKSPNASLIAVNGRLYGTTQFGGSCSVTGCGTIFAISTGGPETILHSFSGGADGAYPSALLDVHGTLYGTAAGGGTENNGTVYSIGPSGAFTIVYMFKGVYSDGSNPASGLTELNGVLYGTTQFGGETREGTAYSLTTRGSESVLHSFGDTTDGQQPVAALVAVGGTLYGTTLLGGGTGCGGLGCGTVFAMTPSVSTGINRHLPKYH